MFILYVRQPCTEREVLSMGVFRHYCCLGPVPKVNYLMTVEKKKEEDYDKVERKVARKELHVR